MMKHLKSILTLFVICAIVSVALAAVNGITAPIILERQQQAAAGALLEVLPEGGTFEEMEIADLGLPATVKAAHKASNGGYVIQIEWAGFNTGNVTMVGISADGKVVGTKCITVKDQGGDNGKDSMKEIPLMDANGHFVGADLNTIEGVDLVAGVTTSSKAYRAAVKDALAAATILGGGSYRDPAQILSDNLNAALGLEGAEFTKHFMVELLDGVKAIYVEKTGAGRVVVTVDGKYIGIGADGNVVAGVDAETNEIVVADADKALAEGAIVTITATTYTDLDPRAYDGVSKRVLSAKVTNAGVYILEVEGAGFGKKGSSDYGASGEYLVIRIALTANGDIVDCYTVYQSETEGFGDACAKEEFYGQFAGKTQENYEDIIIAGSTYTTDGYHSAIKNAFKAVAKFAEGGAQ